MIHLLPVLVPLASQAQFPAAPPDTLPTWQETIAFYEHLARERHGAHLLELGHDDGGQALHLFVLADGSPCHPDSIRAQDKNILWITNGIHPGEPDGVVATMQLVQALLDNDQLMGLLSRTAVCVVPTYNVSGALATGRPSRPDQNGPVGHGVRTTARNLDLNRDFAKRDSRNARDLVQALTFWDPDLYVETHVTNGADHTYHMELLTTHPDKLDKGLAAFLGGVLLPTIHDRLGEKGIHTFPYFELMGEVPDSGLTGFIDSPRYSTGFNALFDRLGLMTESHMLKPWPARVAATRETLVAVLITMDRHADLLMATRAAARLRTSTTARYGLDHQFDTSAVEELPFAGYAFTYEPSAVSGLPRLKYDASRPVDLQVKWMDRIAPRVVVEKPAAYLVPQAWPEVIARLRESGAPSRVLARDSVMTVEEMSISNYLSSRGPVEGRTLHRQVEVDIRTVERTFRVGDVLFPMGHPTDRYVVSMLDPRGEDSFFAWGFFDTVLQRKEGFSDYVFEDRAAELLQRDEALRLALEARRQADTDFAADAHAQLQFIFDRSPWAEEAYRLQPVFRVP